jgi:hypothetical protein
VSHALHVAPVKPVLHAQVQDVGAPLTELAWPLQGLAVVQETQVG